MKNKESAPMPGLVYFRNQRVGSSRFLASFPTIKYRKATSHMCCMSHKAHFINEFSEKEWTKVKKVVSVRNPWAQHQSQFMKREWKTIYGINSYQRLRGRSSRDFYKQSKKTQQKIKDLFKFTVDSQYNAYKNKIFKKQGMTPEELIKSGTYSVAPFRWCYISWQIYTCKNEIMADLCLRTDSPKLEKEMNELLQLLDCAYSKQAIGKVKSYLKDNKKTPERKGFIDYREFYDKEAIEKVGEMRSMEINTHNYKF